MPVIHLRQSTRSGDQGRTFWNILACDLLSMFASLKTDSLTFLHTCSLSISFKRIASFSAPDISQESRWTMDTFSHVDPHSRCFLLIIPSFYFVEYSKQQVGPRDVSRHSLRRSFTMIVVFGGCEQREISPVPTRGWRSVHFLLAKN